MINEEKVILMTKCACYEKQKGKKQLPLAGYFKRDYVKYNILKTLLCVIVACVLLFGIFVFTEYEIIFEKLNRMQFKGMIVHSVLIVAGVLIFYYIVAWMVYRKRFEQAREGVKEYYNNLKKLKKFYSSEQDNSPKVFEKGGIDDNNDEFIDY